MSDTWGLTASMYWKCWSEDENQVSSPKIGAVTKIKKYPLKFSDLKILACEAKKYDFLGSHARIFKLIKNLRYFLIFVTVLVSKIGQFLGYPASHIYIANPPNSLTSAFLCIHMSIYS